MVLIMSKKKVFLLISFVVMISLFASSVSAQEEGGLAGVAETIEKLFGFLPNVITLEKLIGQEAAAMFWAKFLLWLLLFSVVYFGAGFVFKDNKNVATVVAIVIALMGALMIPYTMLVSIFQTYGLLAGIIIWVVPVAAGMYIAHQVTVPFVKALIYGAAAWILWSINATVVEKMGYFNTSFPYFSILFAVVVIMFIWNVIGIFGGGQGQASAHGWAGGLGRGAWNWLTGDRPGTPPATTLPTDDTATQRERDAQEQSVHIQNARERLTGLEAQLQQKIQDPDIHARFAGISLLLIELREVQQALDAAENEIRGRT